jgi:hypothetical protein
MAYEAEQDPLLASKYKARAHIVRMRELGAIQYQEGEGKDHGKPQGIPPAIKPVSLESSQEHTSHKVESAPAFSGHKLTQEQEDALSLHLAKILQNECLWTLARRVISQIKAADNMEVQ